MICLSIQSDKNGITYLEAEKEVKEHFRYDYKTCNFVEWAHALNQPSTNNVKETITTAKQNPSQTASTRYLSTPSTSKEIISGDILKTTVSLKK